MKFLQAIIGSYQHLPKALSAAFWLCLSPAVWAQFVYFEDFSDTQAEGWELVQDNSAPGPRLTAEVPPASADPEFGDVQIDASGNGWMRLATTANDQANAIFLDFAIPAAGTKVTSTFDFTMWDDQGIDNGGDGIVFFVHDYDSTFDPGAFGGSLGYAQKTGIDGVPDGYFGVGLDVYGNYSNASEGRVGGSGFDDNAVAIRGPGDGTSGYEYIAGTGDTPGGLEAIVPGSNDQLDYASLNTRPDQDAEQYRRAKVELDENDVLTVWVEFGYGTGFVEVVSADLSTYGTRPEEFRIGFSAGTGGANQVYEIRNLQVELEGGSNAQYWDNQAANGQWASATNWDTDTLPANNATLFFSDFYASNDADTSISLGSNRRVGNILLGGIHSYTFNFNTLQMEADTGSLTSAISVMKSPTGDTDHTINSRIDLFNDLRINQYTNQTLNLNNPIRLRGYDLDFRTFGDILVAGRIRKTGDINIRGPGLVQFSHSSNDYTGTTTVQSGTLRLASNNALGNASNSAVVLNGGTIDLASGTVTPAGQSLQVAGTGTSNQGALTASSGSNTWSGSIALTADTTFGALGSSTLNIDGVIDTSNADGFDLTLYADPDATVSINNNITDPWWNDARLIKTGTGLGILTANTAYTGNTLVQEGTLRADVAGALGQSWAGEVIVSDGATLALGGGGFTLGGKNITLSGDGASSQAALWTNSGNHTYTATLTLADDASIGVANAADTLQINNSLVGSGYGLTIRGDGTTRFQNALTNVSSVTIESGELFTNGWNLIDDSAPVVINAAGTWRAQNGDTFGSLAGAGDLILNSTSADLTFGGDNSSTVFSGSISGSGDLTKTGSGNMTFSGSNSFDSLLRVNQGTVTLGANDAFADNMALRLNGGTFAIDGFSDTLGDFTLENTSTFDFLGQSGGFLTFDDMTRFNGALTINNWIGNTSGGGDTRLLVTASSLGGSLLTNTTFTGWGTADLINVAPGLYEIVPTTAGFYEWDETSGGTQPWKSTSKWTSGTHTGGQNGVPDHFNEDALLGANVAAGLDINRSGMGSNNNLRNLLIDNAVAFTISGDPLGMNSGQTVTGNHVNGSTISGNGPANITLLGSTSPTFTARIEAEDFLNINNNSTGLLTINDFRFDDSSPSSPDVTYVKFDGSGTTHILGTIDETASSDDGRIIKNGLGTLRISGSNTATGGLEINNGLLQIGSNSAAGTGTLWIEGGTLEAFSADRSLANTFEINNSFSVTGSNALTLSGSGSLISGTSSLTIDPDASLNLSGTLSGTGGLSKQGDGNLFLLNGNNSFSGNLSVDAGQLYGLRTSAGNFTFGASAVGQNLLGLGDTFTVNGGEGGAILQNGGTLTIASGGTLQVNGGEAHFWNFDSNTPPTSDDFLFAGTANVSAGSLQMGSSRDMTFQAGSSLNLTGGTAGFFVDRDFLTTGTSLNPSTFNISGTAQLDIFGSASGGSNVTLDADDTWEVSGTDASLNITQTSGSTGAAFLNGQLNLSDGATLSVSGMNTTLAASTILDGGTTPVKGALIVTNDLSVDEPALSNSPNITLNNSVAAQISAPNPGSSLTNVGTLTKSGSGTTTISNQINNIQASNLVIEGGTLLLGDDDQIANTTAMTLTGGAFSTGGYNEIVASLTLSSTSTIDMGNATSTLEFLGQGTRTAGSLLIQNWSGNENGGGTDQIIFGSSLDSAFLSNVVWKDFYGPGQDQTGSRLIDLGNGRYELVPVPEPRFYIGAALLLGLLLAHWHRQRTN